METQTFPCPACGAPVTPEPGLERMTCPYCHTQLTIPDNLQRKAPPPLNESSRGEPPQLSPQETQQQVTDFLRQAQPMAARAFNLYALTSGLRRFVPGCIMTIMAACGIACFLFALLLNFLRE